jgi:hypothetical protein
MGQYTHMYAADRKRERETVPDQEKEKRYE